METVRNRVRDVVEAHDASMGIRSGTWKVTRASPAREEESRFMLEWEKAVNRAQQAISDCKEEVPPVTRARLSLYDAKRRAFAKAIVLQEPLAGDRGQLEHLTQEMLSAAKVGEENRDEALQETALESLGLLLGWAGDGEASLSYFKKSLELKRTEQKSKDILFAYAGILFPKSPMLMEQGYSRNLPAFVAESPVKDEKAREFFRGFWSEYMYLRRVLGRGAKDIVPQDSPCDRIALTMTAFAHLLLNQFAAMPPPPPAAADTPPATGPEGEAAGEAAGAAQDEAVSDRVALGTMCSGVLREAITLNYLGALWEDCCRVAKQRAQVMAEIKAPHDAVQMALQELNLIAGKMGAKFMTPEMEEAKEILRGLGTFAETMCVACGATSDKMQRCSVCKEARYCSRACQTAHWPRHKPVCKKTASGGA